MNGPLLRRSTATGREAAIALVLGPSAALIEARPGGVRHFERRPALHTVILGRARLEVRGRVVHTEGAFAVPAGLPHRLLAMEGPLGGVAHLDVRRYRFEDAAALADTWRGFVLGRDQLTEAFGDTLRLPPRRLAPRLSRALDALDGAGVAAAAAQVGLSASRLTHLVTDALGVAPRVLRGWFRLRRALGAALLDHRTLTYAAHEAEFSDSAHLTRTCKRLMGVRPAEMLPPVIYVSREG